MKIKFTICVLKRTLMGRLKFNSFPRRNAVCWLPYPSAVLSHSPFPPGKHYHGTHSPESQGEGLAFLSHVWLIKNNFPSNTFNHKAGNTYPLIFICFFTFILCFSTFLLLPMHFGMYQLCAANTRNEKYPSRGWEFRHFLHPPHTATSG